MITEAIVLQVKPGLTEAYENNFRKASEIIKRAKGYISHELHKCMEMDNQYLLIIRWETYDNHMVDFRTSADFQEWRALLHEFYASAPNVYHYNAVYG
jgi:heme-degrading monooxygenase HmoA